MNDDHSDPLQKLRNTQTALSKGISIATAMLGIIRHQVDDHFAFMAATFFAKQIGHAEAMLLLNDHQDTQLIARSMLEGMCYLFWAYRDNPARALRWRQYSYVLDWRYLRSLDAAGIPVEAERRTAVEAAIAAHGGAFHSDKARKCIKQGKPLPLDPYEFDWAGQTIRSVFLEVNSVKVYEKSYSWFSAWHHWSPGGIGLALSEVGDDIVLHTRLPKTACESANLAAAALYDTCTLVNTSLKLAFHTQLDAFKSSLEELSGPKVQGA